MPSLTRRSLLAALSTIPVAVASVLPSIHPPQKAPVNAYLWIHFTDQESRSAALESFMEKETGKMVRVISDPATLHGRRTHYSKERAKHIAAGMLGVSYQLIGHPNDVRSNCGLYVADIATRETMGC